MLDLKIDDVPVFETLTRSRIGGRSNTIAGGTTEYPFTVISVGERQVVPSTVTTSEPSTVDVVNLKENLVSVVDVGGGSSESRQARNNFEKVHFVNRWVVD